MLSLSHYSGSLGLEEKQLHSISLCLAFNPNVQSVVGVDVRNDCHIVLVSCVPSPGLPKSRSEAEAHRLWLGNHESQSSRKQKQKETAEEGVLTQEDQLLSSFHCQVPRTHFRDSCKMYFQALVLSNNHQALQRDCGNIILSRLPQEEGGENFPSALASTGHRFTPHTLPTCIHTYGR